MLDAQVNVADSRGDQLEGLVGEAINLLLVYERLSIDNHCPFVRVAAVYKADRDRLPILWASIIHASLFVLEAPIVLLLGSAEKGAN